jgi:hypothetical protein
MKLSSLLKGCITWGVMLSALLPRDAAADNPVIPGLDACKQVARNLHDWKATIKLNIDQCISSLPFHTSCLLSWYQDHKIDWSDDWVLTCNKKYWDDVEMHIFQTRDYLRSSIWFRTWEKQCNVDGISFIFEYWDFQNAQSLPQPEGTVVHRSKWKCENVEIKTFANKREILVW